MVKYFEVDEDLKNRYHIADILTKTYFVAGFESVYQMFCEKVKETKEQQSSKIHQRIKDKLMENLEEFNVGKHFNLFQNQKTINVKLVIY